MIGALSIAASFGELIHILYYILLSYLFNRPSGRTIKWIPPQLTSQQHFYFQLVNISTTEQNTIRGDHKLWTLVGAGPGATRGSEAEKQ